MGPRKPVARDAVAIAFKADQAGWRDALADLNEAVEGHRQGHQGRPFLSPDIGNGPGQRAMGRLMPQGDATLFQPVIQRSQVGEVRHALQHLMAGVADVLLDLTLRQRARTDGATPAQSHPAAGLQKSGSKT